MRQVFPSDWRTQNKWKRRFYATYMRNLERFGYAIVFCIFLAFIFAFNYKVNDVLKADGVDLRPASVPITCSERCVVVENLVADFADVQVGMPVVRIARGERNIAAHRARVAVRQLAEASGSVKADVLAIPEPELITVVAPASGVFRLRGVGEMSAGDTIAEVLNYAELEIKASFEGQTVAKAKLQDSVSISNLVMADGKTDLFRGSSPAGPVISTKLLGTDVQKALSGSLKGKSIVLRDDVPMQIKEITSVEVDADITTSEVTADSRTFLLDPSEDNKLAGTVVSGAHVSNIQLTSLPSAFLATATASVASRVKGTHVETPGGKTVAIEDLSNVRVSVKVAAEAGGTTDTLLSGTALKRKYDAVIRITSPPNYLVRIMKAADREGKSIKARAELITGSRPIAFILLKKS